VWRRTNGLAVAKVLPDTIVAALFKQSRRGRLRSRRLGRLLPTNPQGDGSMFITPAYAQMPGGSDPFTGLLIPMLAMVLIFYFLVIRPQQSRAKAHRELVNQVRRGDTVITSGGFIGKVTKSSDTSDEVEVELSDSMRVRVLKSTLMDVRSKGEPTKETT
jgi:preprotein translocase subunit YajC